MECLDEHIDNRRKLKKMYRRELNTFEGISFPEENTEGKSNHWLTTILVDEKKTGVNREKIRVELEKENIESRPLWKPMHLQPVFRNELYFGENESGKLFESGLCLPSGSSLREEDQQKTVVIIKELLTKHLTV
jgi:dTDP-4-amino-4,6-dideoxygalactose transaminase